MKIGSPGRPAASDRVAQGVTDAGCAARRGDRAVVPDRGALSSGERSVIHGEGSRLMPGQTPSTLAAVQGKRHGLACYSRQRNQGVAEKTGGHVAECEQPLKRKMQHFLQCAICKRASGRRGRSPTRRRWQRHGVRRQGWRLGSGGTACGQAMHRTCPAPICPWRARRACWRAPSPARSQARRSACR